MARRNPTSRDGHQFSPPRNFNIPKVDKTKASGTLEYVSRADRESRELMKDVDCTCFFRPPEKYRNQWHVAAVRMARPSPVVDSRYRQKWSEMKKRHGNQPLQEVLGFYVCKDKMQARMIVKYGLRTGCSNSRNLGNPHQGVYLYRHVDLALLSRMGRKSVFIFVFQVHLGRTKRLPPVNSGRVPLIEPTPNFDAHVSNTPPHNDDTSADICRKSQMYLYEYTDEAVPSQYPPQCLPYALLEFVQENNQNRSSDARLSSEKASTSAADSDQTETVPMFLKKGESGVHRVNFQEFCKERDIEESSRASSSLVSDESSNRQTCQVELTEELSHGAKRKDGGVSGVSLCRPPPRECNSGAQSMLQDTLQQSPETPDFPDSVGLTSVPVTDVRENVCSASNFKPGTAEDMEDESCHSYQQNPRGGTSKKSQNFTDNVLDGERPFSPLFLNFQDPRFYEVCGPSDLRLASGKNETSSSSTARNLDKGPRHMEMESCALSNSEEKQSSFQQPLHPSKTRPKEYFTNRDSRLSRQKKTITSTQQSESCAHSNSEHSNSEEKQSSFQQPLHPSKTRPKEYFTNRDPRLNRQKKTITSAQQSKSSKSCAAVQSQPDQFQNTSAQGIMAVINKLLGDKVKLDTHPVERDPTESWGLTWNEYFLSDPSENTESVQARHTHHQTSDVTTYVHKAGRDISDHKNGDGSFRMNTDVTSSCALPVKGNISICQSEKSMYSELPPPPLPPFLCQPSSLAAHVKTGGLTSSVESVSPRYTQATTSSVSLSSETTPTTAVSQDCQPSRLSILRSFTQLAMKSVGLSAHTTKNTENTSDTSLHGAQSGQKSVVKSLTSEMSSQPSKRPLVPHTGPGKFDGDHQRSDNQSGQQSVFRSLTGVIPGYPTQQPSTVSAPETGLEQFKDDGQHCGVNRTMTSTQCIQSAGITAPSGVPSQQRLSSQQRSHPTETECRLPNVASKSVQQKGKGVGLERLIVPPPAVTERDGRGEMYKSILSALQSSVMEKGDRPDDSARCVLPTSETSSHSEQRREAQCTHPDTNRSRRSAVGVDGASTSRWEASSQQGSAQRGVRSGDARSYGTVKESATDSPDVTPSNGKQHHHDTVACEHRQSKKPEQGAAARPVETSHQAELAATSMQRDAVPQSQDSCITDSPGPKLTVSTEQEQNLCMNKSGNSTPQLDLETENFSCTATQPDTGSENRSKSISQQPLLCHTLKDSRTGNDWNTALLPRESSDLSKDPGQQDAVQPSGNEENTLCISAKEQDHSVDKNGRSTLIHLGAQRELDKKLDENSQNTANLHGVDHREMDKKAELQNTVLEKSPPQNISQDTQQDCENEIDESSALLSHTDANLNKKAGRQDAVSESQESIAHEYSESQTGTANHSSAVSFHLPVLGAISSDSNSENEKAVDFPGLHAAMAEMDVNSLIQQRPEGLCARQTMHADHKAEASRQTMHADHKAEASRQTMHADHKAEASTGRRLNLKQMEKETDITDPPEWLENHGEQAEAGADNMGTSLDPASRGLTSSSQCESKAAVHTQLTDLVVKKEPVSSTGSESHALPLSSMGLQHWMEALVDPRLNPVLPLVDIYEAYLGTSVFDFDNCVICQKVTDAASSQEQAEDEGTHSLSAPVEGNRPGTPAVKLVDVEISSPDESGKEVEDDKENHSPWTTSVQNSSYIGGRAAHVSPQNSKDEVETNRNFEGSSSALLAAAESKHKPSAMSQTTAKGGNQTVQLSKDDLAEFSVKHQSAEDSTKHQSAEDSTKHQSAKDSMKHQSAEHSTAYELEVSLREQSFEHASEDQCSATVAGEHSTGNSSGNQLTSCSLNSTSTTLVEKGEAGVCSLSTQKQKSGGNSAGFFNSKRRHEVGSPVGASFSRNAHPRNLIPSSPGSPRKRVQLCEKDLSANQEENKNLPEMQNDTYCEKDVITGSPVPTLACGARGTHAARGDRHQRDRDTGDEVSYSSTSGQPLYSQPLPVVSMSSHYAAGSHMQYKSFSHSSHRHPHTYQGWSQTSGMAEALPECAQRGHSQQSDKKDILDYFQDIVGEKRKPPSDTEPKLESKRLKQDFSARDSSHSGNQKQKASDTSETKSASCDRSHERKRKSDSSETLRNNDCESTLGAKKQKVSAGTGKWSSKGSISLKGDKICSIQERSAKIESKQHTPSQTIEKIQTEHRAVPSKTDVDRSHDKMSRASEKVTAGNKCSSKTSDISRKKNISDMNRLFAGYGGSDKVTDCLHSRQILDDERSLMPKAEKSVAGQTGGQRKEKGNEKDDSIPRNRDWLSSDECQAKPKKKCAVHPLRLRTEDRDNLHGQAHCTQRVCTDRVKGSSSHGIQKDTHTLVCAETDRCSPLILPNSSPGVSGDSEILANAGSLSQGQDYTKCETSQSDVNEMYQDEKAVEICPAELVQELSVKEQDLRSTSQGIDSHQSVNADPQMGEAVLQRKDSCQDTVTPKQALRREELSLYENRSSCDHQTDEQVKNSGSDRKFEASASSSKVPDLSRYTSQTSSTADFSASVHTPAEASRNDACVGSMASSLNEECCTVDQIDLELNILSGFLRLREVISSEDGQDDSILPHNLVENLINTDIKTLRKSFNAVIKDFKCALQQIESGLKGKPHQRIPKELLFSDEVNQFYTREGAFAILISSIHVKPYYELVEIKAALEDAVGSGCASSESEMPGWIVNYRHRRKTLMENHTGRVGLKLRNQLQKQLSFYTNCHDHIEGMFGHQSMEKMAFFRISMEAVRRHLQIVQREMRSTE